MKLHRFFTLKCQLIDFYTFAIYVNNKYFSVLRRLTPFPNIIVCCIIIVIKKTLVSIQIQLHHWITYSCMAVNFPFSKYTYLCLGYTHCS